MKEYMKTENEFKPNCNLFDLNLEDLIMEKMFLLFEKLQPLNNSLKEVTIKYEIEHDKLLMETDFETVLAVKRPTIAMKEAYIKPFTADLQDKIDEQNEQITKYKDKINIINDLIKMRRLELKIEANLE